MRKPIDIVLFTAIVALLTLGSIMVFSAGAVFAEQKHGASTYFLQRQTFYLTLGGLFMWRFASIDFQRLRKYALPLVAGSLATLVAVLFIGARINGARRWFRLGPLSFQPAELAKLALVIFLAHSLAKQMQSLDRTGDKPARSTLAFLPQLLIASIMLGLVLVQPDLGTAAILGFTTVAMLFVSGAKMSYLFIIVLAAAPIAWKHLAGTPWRLKRVVAFLDPWPFRRDIGYQITESLISVGSGGMHGLGLGDGRQKLFFLPEAHTDFILSILCEELGFVGFCGVILLFGLLVWRGLRAAFSARDAFGTYLAFGITMLFAAQALINIGVVLGSLPTKGLTLPFVSYGGSSLVVTMAMAGILLNVSRLQPAPVGPDLEEAQRVSFFRRLLRPRLSRNRAMGQQVVIESE
jgi:cell division protein FtsW